MLKAGDKVYYIQHSTAGGVTMSSIAIGTVMDVCDGEITLWDTPSVSRNALFYYPACKEVEALLREYASMLTMHRLQAVDMDVRLQILRQDIAFAGGAR